MYKSELTPREPPVTAMTHPEWQLTEYFHILLTSQKPGSQAELLNLPHSTGKETEVQEGVMCPKS